MMEHGSKEYYEKQSEYWFVEASKFVAEADDLRNQRDSFIADVADLRNQRDKLQNELNKILEDE